MDARLQAEAKQILCYTLLRLLLIMMMMTMMTTMIMMTFLNTYLQFRRNDSHKQSLYCV
jgi:hypothetical protein